MSWGKPVIGRNSGATPELVRDGVNGMLYEHSIDALARAMEAMIADPSSCRAMGLAATKFAAGFSNERVASDFLAALN
jgi:glycosyltransferase involved in cell wall biosynthesis